MLDSTHGLPGVQIRALHQDRRGRIWVGTEAGVALLQGDHFEPLRADLPAAGAFTLDLSSEGDWLYSLTEKGVYRTSMEGAPRSERLVELDLKSVLGRFGRDEAGQLYVATEVGVYLLQEGEARLLIPGGPDLQPRAVLGEGGGLWIAAAQGLYRWEPGRGLRQRDGRAARDLLSSEGGMLVGLEEGVARLSGGELELLRRGCYTTDLDRLTDGRVLAGCGNGLLLSTPEGGWESFGEGEGPPGSIVTRVLADSEGLVWLGSLNQGLGRVVEVDLRLWGHEDPELSSSTMAGLAQVGPELLVLNFQGVKLVGPDMEVREPSDEELRQNVLRMEMAEGQTFYTRAMQGVFQQGKGPDRQVYADRQGRITFLRSATHTLAINRAETVELLPAGGIWPNPPGLHGAARRHDGEDWGVAPDGLYRFRKGWERVAGLPEGCAGHLRVATSTPSGWFLGCDRVLYRGRRPEEAEPLLELGQEGRFHAMMHVGGRAWATSASTLFALEPEPQGFGRVEGLPHLQFVPGDGTLAMHQGWLVASTSAGLLWLRPELLERRRLAPEPTLLGLEAGGRSLSSFEELRPEDNDLQLRVGARSNAGLDHLRWRFRLDGGEWLPHSGADPIRLPGVSPGRHRLEVQAQARGSGWSEPMSLGWTQPRPWHQRPELQAGLALAAVGLAGFMWWQRTQRMRAELQRLREREELQSLFGRFVTPEIAEEVLAGRLRPEGELIEATVLFVDLRGFTPLSERLPPQQLVAVLNRWFSRMIADVEREGGVVNKLMGDALVAVFGAPRPMPDHADRALRAGLAMLASMDLLAPELEREFGERLSAGVGINTGPVVAGPIGAQSRMEYTVIGETVNVAARVEAATRTLGVPLLMTEATRASIRKLPPVLSMGSQRLKGVGQPVQLWAVQAAGQAEEEPQWAPRGERIRAALR